MAEKTAIEWTDATWNPIRGCSKVSPGCKNCYAEKIAMRFCDFGHDCHGREAQPFWRFADENGWTGLVELQEHKLEEPLHWRKPRRVFVNSMSDLFHEALPDEAIDRVFAVMALCPQHTFQVLTKRGERLSSWFDGIDHRRCGYWCEHGGYLQDLAVKAGILSRDEAQRRVAMAVQRWRPELPPTPESLGDASLYHIPWPLRNVHLGVSVESQKTWRDCWYWLRKTPAARRFISYEPALEAVDFHLVTRTWADSGGNLRCDHCCNGDRRDDPTHRDRQNCLRCFGDSKAINPDQIIVGGESGPGARPCDLAWIRTAVRQCRAAGTKVFIKQLGSRPEIDWDIEDEEWPNHVIPEAFEYPTREVRLNSRKGGDMTEWPKDLRIREMPEVQR